MRCWGWGWGSQGADEGQMPSPLWGHMCVCGCVCVSPGVHPHVCVGKLQNHKMLEQRWNFMVPLEKQRLTDNVGS